MAFQIKDFVSIVASIINYAKSVQTKVSDFTVGSAIRTLLESPAIEIDELYQQMVNGLTEAIPVAIYNSFDFSQLPAIPSSGTIRVTITSSPTPVLIPAGTLFSSAQTPVKFVSSQDVTIAPGGTTADVFVSAQSPGFASNVQAGIAWTVFPIPSGLLSATNLAAFTNGSDKESDSQRKLRFAQYIAALNHGTLAALNYGMRTVQLLDSNGLVTEYVKHVSIVEPYKLSPANPIALVNVYIHNGSTGASSGLLNRAIEVMEGYYDASGKPVSGWKAAGVKVDIAAATNVSINVTATLTPAPGYLSAPLIAAAQDAIRQYITGLDIGVTAIRAELIAAAMAIEGVYNFVVTTPASDTAASSSQKCIPGTINIT